MPSSAIDLLSSAGTVIAALIAVVALLEGRAARSRDRREARTSVCAWATMAGKDIRESGVQLHVRNNTDSALIGAAARVFPLHLPPSEPEPDGTVPGASSLPVLLVSPMQTVTFPLAGGLFKAYGEGWSELAAAITFRDNTGQVWAVKPTACCAAASASTSSAIPSTSTTRSARSTVRVPQLVAPAPRPPRRGALGGSPAPRRAHRGPQRCSTEPVTCDP